MLELTIYRYARPDYFQAHLVQNGIQVMTFFFANANETVIDDDCHVSFFAHDNDTTACMNLSTVVMNLASRKALDLAIELDKKVQFRKQDEAPQAGADSSAFVEVS
ncbi:hypothetical protein [Vibrio sp. B1FLJ16]|uniref:hypothetical protein n=1 Tax=Vibrio sp. B1FLJ16 TaxID=2751178 RepID=UPI0015F5CA1B|nr:hypothetical protein [Vibrio sp. B1FLJ16]CAD7805941.1 hypothetical protein ACOMICROBIO_EPCKBFOG_01455 [Vibrio sp. B1FLJ16]CAE6901989.1 hypothetical protein ACOMICROBIO_EPCKBFOG_01455 [Vibrio sp. B1FLJ16]